MENGLLNRLAVVLFKPKFPENVGSTARAMANMGLRDLILVAPQDFDLGRAQALATSKGQGILERMSIVADLAQALAPFQAVYGTTARTGGWRKGLITPETAAARGLAVLREGGRAAVLFGPEDKGLTNEETKVCSRLLTIPTAVEASSLNLAQAVLIVLYEFLKAATARPRRTAPPRDAHAPDAAHGEGTATKDERSDEAFGPGDPCQEESPSPIGRPGQAFGTGDPDRKGTPSPDASPDAASRPDPGLPRHAGSAVTHREREALFENLRQTLLAIDFLGRDNPDYWMLPVRAFVERIGLKRGEFNMLMGLCRQVKWAVGRREKPGG